MKSNWRVEVTKKWDDPQLDAAQFAIDRFLSAQQNVSEHMSGLYQSTAMEALQTKTGRD